MHQSIQLTESPLTFGYFADDDEDDSTRALTLLATLSTNVLYSLTPSERLSLVQMIKRGLEAATKQEVLVFTREDAEEEVWVETDEEQPLNL